MKNLTLIANTISKEYRSKTVVNSVSLEVNQGEIVGLLGPNGAGKLHLYIIVGLIQPNSGKIFWAVKILLLCLCIKEPVKE